MSDTSAVKNNIMIGTPCYGGQVFTNYLTSVLGLVITAQKRNDLNLGFRVRGGDSLITRARNSIVAEFLASEQFTHLLWIDADIGFTPDAIYRLINSGHDIAAGIYPLKALTLPDELNGNRDELFKKHQRYPFNPVDPKNIDVKNGFIEVKDAPTGLMLIKREVLEKMVEAYPELKYNPDRQVGLEGIAAKIADHYYNFFDTFIDESGRYLSEDYAFCLDSQSKVETEDGLKTIKWICDNAYTGKVRSLNAETGQMGWNHVVGHSARRNGKRGKPSTKKTWVRINTDADNNTKSKPIVTADHQIAVVEDILKPKVSFVEAGCSVNLFGVRQPQRHENPLFNPNQTSALIGCLLGDGSISGHSQFSTTHGDPQWEYVVAKQKLFGGKITTRPQTGFGKGHLAHRLMVPVNAQTRALRRYLYDGESKSIQRIITYIDDISLAFWYMDDGSLGTNGCPVLCTNNFSYADNKSLVEMFKDRWDIDASIHTKTVQYKGEVRQYPYIYITKHSADRFFDIVSKYIVPCLEYKLPAAHRDAEKHTLNTKPLDYAAARITEARVLKSHSSKLYDIEVENDHTFIANGAIVHNCRLWQRIGGRVHADALSKLSHQGSHKFEGDFHGMLTANFSKQEKEG